MHTNHQSSGVVDETGATPAKIVMSIHNLDHHRAECAYSKRKTGSVDAAA